MSGNNYPAYPAYPAYPPAAGGAPQQSSYPSSYPQPPQNAAYPAAYPAGPAPAGPGYPMYPPQQGQQVEQAPYYYPPAEDKKNHLSGGGLAGTTSSSNPYGPGTSAAGGAGPGASTTLHHVPTDLPSGMHDTWAFLLWLLSSIVAFVVAIYFATFVFKKNDNPGSQVSLNTGLEDVDFAKYHLLPLLGGLAVGIGSMVFYAFMITRHTEKTVRVMFPLATVALIAIIILSFVIKNYALLVTVVIFLLIFLLVWFFSRKFIKHTIFMISRATRVMRNYPSIYSYSTITLVLTFAFVFVFSFGAAGSTFKSLTENNHQISALAYVTYVFLFFNIFWSGSVFSNIMHVTVSGLIGQTYFNSNGNAGTVLANPVGHSYRVATTKAIGSICYGSLLIAMVKTLKLIVDLATEDSDGIASQILACLVQCILSCIKDLIEFINTYAFVYVAVYHLPFCDSAKKTMQLLSSSGFGILANYNVVNKISMIASLLCATLTGIVTLLLYMATLKIKEGVQSADATMSFIVSTGVFFLVMLMNYVFNTSLSSAVFANIVVIAENPEVLRLNHPEDWSRYRELFPEVAAFSTI